MRSLPVEWFSEVQTSGLERVKGVIVPHAGWTYSLDTYGT